LLLSADGGEAGGIEIPPEEEENQAEATTALRKGKRVEVSPTGIDSLRRKRTNAASPAKDLGEVNINSTSDSFASFFVHIYNP